MAAIVLPERWRRQPAGVYEVNLNHPLTRGLYAWYSPLLRCNLVTHRGIPAKPTGTAVFGTQMAGNRGIEETYNGTSSGLSWTRANDASGVFSCFAVAWSNSNPAEVRLIGWKRPSGTSTLANIERSFSTWRFQIQDGNGTHALNLDSIIPAASDRVDFLAASAVIGSATGSKLAVNGTCAVGSLASFATTTIADITLGYLDRTSYESAFPGQIAESGWWDRALDEGELREMTRAPYQIVQPKFTRFFSLPAGGGGSSSAVVFRNYYARMRGA